MRFRKYLNESGKNLYDKSTKEIVEMIEKDCQFFLKSRKRSDDYYFRAMRMGEFGTIGISDSRKDRNPRNTPPTIHKWLDDYFNKRFGWRTRSEGLFASPSKDIAEDYGNDVYVIFPIGKYKVIYDTKIEDIFELLDTNSYDIIGYDVISTTQVENALENPEIYKKYFDDLKQILDDHYIEDVPKSFEHKGEIVIKCDKFYYIHTKDFEQMNMDKELKKL